MKITALLVFHFPLWLPVLPAEGFEIIDTHFHAKSNQSGGLDEAVQWLDANGVSRAIDHPIGESRPKNEEERKNMLARNKEYTTQFMIKHRKKLLFGTDCGWWSLKPDEKPAAQFALMRELNFPDEVKMDIYSGNAKRLFGW